MSSCNDRLRFLDAALNEAEQRRFEDHMQVCDECSASVDKWRFFSQTLSAAATKEAADGFPTAGQRRALVDSYRARTEPRPHKRWVWAGSLAAACCAAVVALLLGLGSLRESDPLEIKVEFTSNVAMTQPESPMFNIDRGGKLITSIGVHRVAAAEATALKVMSANINQTRLRLDRGSVACRVKPLKPGAEFLVDAGDVAVRVVGTQFAVTRNERSTMVEVMAGAVEVTAGKSRSHRLTAGQQGVFGGDTEHAITPLSAVAADRFEQMFHPGSVNLVEQPEAVDLRHDASTNRDADAEVADPDNASAGTGNAGELTTKGPEVHRLRSKPPLERWREMVISGRLESARSKMTAHLKRHPSDAKVWSLLADCYRKLGLWSEAVAAYEKVIAYGTVGSANRARYKAAALLQDKLGDDARAAVLLEAFIDTASSDLLKGTAMVRLAKALIRAGQKNRAADLLSQVETEYAGTPAAVTARELLRSKALSPKNRQD
ncbi:MAG: tetratricopeptide repeat protein [Myxococcota bacterium]|nr:tetratricopeptide repeat protein [Myxococcota bacterium]